MGIRKYHCMRLVPNESGIMSTDKVQCREFSCACVNCCTGNECIDPLQIHNQWKNCPLVLKPVQPVNNENLEESGGESDNDNPWDYWDP